MGSINTESDQISIYLENFELSDRTMYKRKAKENW